MIGTQGTGSQDAQRRTFARLIATFLGVQVVILALAIGTLTVTNLIRAYTAGEGLYAKSQKQAVSALQRYAATGDAAYYRDYREALRIPLGDRRARVAMQADPPDREAAREGLLAGGNHPDDVPGMITLFRLMSDTPLFREPVALWSEADALIGDLQEGARALRAVVESPGADSARQDALLADIYELDGRITELENEFSSLLGDRAREIETAAIVLLGSASVLLWLAAIAFGYRLHQRSLAAEAALAHREARLRALMDSTADGIVSVEPGGRIDAVNRAAAEILESRPGALVGRDAAELVVEDDRAEFRAALKSPLADESRVLTGGELHFDGHRGDGANFPMEVAFTKQEYAGEARTIMTFRDISDRILTEARLFQAQKMEAVGQLTGGVAHDFNNLLTVITGNLELLRDDLARAGLPRESRQLIDAALGAADRGARVTSQLLAFSRRQPLAPAPVHIDTLIRGASDLLAQGLSGAIELDYRLEAGGWHAMVDPVQLEAALLNLVLNARHAIKGGGRIEIGSGRHYIDERSGAHLDLAPGEYVVVSVRDDGVGIPAEHLPRVFDPFFTTREVGSGSGLGLSMVQGFAKQSGGQVRIDSRVGEGTTVELFLPRGRPVATAASPDPADAASAARARILVVEDNASLRDIAIRMLQLKGFEAEGAASATEALAQVETGRTPDLVLSDVVLPGGMDGFALARRLKENCPDVAILLMSGYPRDSLADPDAMNFRLLLKPWTREQLTRAVGELLAEKSGA